MAELPSRFGLMLPGTDIRGSLELARHADRIGVDSLWVYETRLATDAIVPLGIYASVTERARLGTGIIPMWTRNPALIAQTFATLDLIAPGRVILGLGAWWEPLATRVGVKRESPVKAMQEVVEAVRLLLSLKEHVTYHGEYVHLDDVYLDHGGTTPHDVKIYIAAVGPQMLRLAGRIADGVVLNFQHTVGAIRQAVEAVKEGAESAGRSLEDVDRAQLQTVRVGRDKKRALEEGKPFLAQYIAQQPHIEGGTEMDPELARRIKEIIPWPATPQQVMEGAKLITDELIESVGCYGDADEVRSRLKEYKDAGVTMPIVSIGSRGDVDALAAGF